MGLFDRLTKSVRDSLNSDIEALNKADVVPDPNNIPETPQDPSNEQKIGRQAIIDDPYYDSVQQHFIFKNKTSRLTNKTLRDTSVRDWLVSTIIQHRADTLVQFARPQRKQFDTGFKFVKRNSTDNLTEQEKQEIANLEEFVLRCGRTDKTPIEDTMSFAEFLKLTSRDALTFGHIGVEKILTRRGAIHRFRPVPGDSLYLINQKSQKEVIEQHIKNARTLYNKAKEFQYGNSPEDSYEVNKPDTDYFKYVQMSEDNRVMEAFGELDMVFKLFNPQNFSDSNGYCYSPLELSIINVTAHLNVENYNSNFFTHGYAARGVLHLKGTVTQPQLTAFRRQFYNTISGTQHAWRTPIVSGLDDVQWVPLSGSAREMEYLNYNNHIMRAVCSQFQIDPMELGLDYLVSGTNRSSANSSSNEFKINFSRERGLYPLLLMYEDLINSDLLPCLDKGLADKYEFKFVGYTDETPQTNAALLQAEMTIHSTMNDLLSSANKEKWDHPIFDLPLNQTFWQLVDTMMTRGEARELFLNDKGASKRPSLQYLPKDPAFLSWQQMLMTINRTKHQDKMEKEQMEAQQQQAQIEQQQQEAEAQQQQVVDQREQEKHDAEMEAHKNAKAHAVAKHKSLKDIAKESGFATEPINVGGTPTSNPINDFGSDE
jgi:hypothetical protein